jgi:choline dehydrogenase-like flavoprotein
MFINGEDLPRSDNRITLNSNVKDTYGLPVANVHVDEHANDQAMRKHAQGQMTRMYEAIGAKRVIVGPTPPATHNLCTARMSADPRNGVTNGWGQTHDVKNLFISDGSVLSTPGSANPTLTIRGAGAATSRVHQPADESRECKSGQCQCSVAFSAPKPI